MIDKVNIDVFGIRVILATCILDQGFPNCGTLTISSTIASG